jgi:hypothetical protein
MQQGKMPMQHAAPATQHAPAAAANTLEEPTNAATAAKNFKDLVFIKLPSIVQLMIRECFDAHSK